MQAEQTKTNEAAQRLLKEQPRVKTFFEGFAKRLG